MVLDENFLVEDWKIEKVNKVLSIAYANWQEYKFYAYMDTYKIDKDLKVKELSTGTYKKLLLAIALCHGANTLILDKPTSGLDPNSRRDFLEMLQEFIQDKNNTILFSSHITQDLEEIADFIVFIYDGEIVYYGLKDDLLEEFVIIKGGAEDFKNIDKKLLLGTRS